MTPYKIILADDEKILRESIGKLVDWAKLECELVALPKDGEEAISCIKEHNPHIVITDIKMPRLNGLQVIEQGLMINSKLRFVILSGFGEFEYAKSAMSFGVKDYILKPCDEKDIENTIKKIIREIETENSNELFLLGIQNKLSKVLPQVKESYFRDMLLSYNGYGHKYFLELIAEPNQEFILLSLFTEDSKEFIEKFALENIAQEILTKNLICATTIIKDNVYILIKQQSFEELSKALMAIQDSFYNIFKIRCTIAISEPLPIECINIMHSQVNRCMGYRFYVSQGAIITISDVPQEVFSEIGYQHLNFEEISNFVSAGNIYETEKNIHEFIDNMKKINDVQTVINYCMSLYLEIIRHSNKQHEYMLFITKIKDMCLDDISEFMIKVAQEIASQRYESNQIKYCQLVKTLLSYVEDNLSNPDLTLNYIAKEILYMNSDYLGRLFLKEMGIKFTNYINKRRILVAQKLIEQSPDVKVYEVADKVGFLDNPQYFSQMFKKITGMTPKEYISYCHS